MIYPHKLLSFFTLIISSREALKTLYAKGENCDFMKVSSVPVCYAEVRLVGVLLLCCYV